MQGSRSSATMLPEILIFDNDSTSNDAGIDSPLPWNNIPIPAQNPLPSSVTHIQYPQQHARRNLRMAEWYLGETSSNLRPYNPYDILSSDNNGIINPSINQGSNGSFVFPNSSIPSTAAIPRDLNMGLEFEDQEDDDDDEEDDDDDEDDDCRVIGSYNSGNTVNGHGDRPGCSTSDGQRVSCKRKALEFQAGPSSGSSSFFQNTERRQWHTIPENNISAMPVPPENNSIANNAQEQANNGLRLGGGHAFSPNHFSSTTSANDEISRRNFRLRIHGLHHQDPILPENTFLSDPADVGNVDFLSSSRQSSRLAVRNRLHDSNPSPGVENGSLHGQSSLLEVPNPTVRRSHQSRWSGSPSARISRSSAALYDEPANRTIPRRLSDHPMFVPAGETGNSSQSPTNWNFSGVGGNINNNSNLNTNITNSTTAANAPSASRVGFVRGESSSAAGGSRRSLPQYQRRLSEIVRRSLLLSERTVDNNNVGRSQEMAFPAVPNSNSNNTVGRHVPVSRSGLLEGHLDGGGASGVPHSLRSLAAGSEGRSSNAMSEIRHVLDLMRRGEGLRFEDVMILDHSVLVGMADINDRHRDMRLDVDSMSYEELLALEERIGNVCTGLSEETVLRLLKQRKFVDFKGDQAETEPCSICREEYNNGEDIGTLECGHDFHRDCIKQWLVQKNLCPICKTTGLKNTSDEH